MSRRLFVLIPALLLLALLAPVLPAPEAWAEEGAEAGDDLEAKIKAKFEHILELMRQNEEALLRLSAGKDGQPRRVDVEIPPPPAGAGQGAAGEGAGSAGTGSTGTGGEAGGESGAEGGEGAKGAVEGTEAIRQEMQRLLESMTRGAGTIPEEIKELVQLIPT
jgi:hypothetical protein